VKISDKTLALTLPVVCGFINQYRKNPGDFGLALKAAVQKASTLNQSLVVLTGNSYGRMVHHIVRPEEDLSRYNPGVSCASAYVVEPDGRVFYATASK
jgi:hypothetical protein